MTFKDFLDWARDNWATLMAAPLTFGVFVIIAATAAFLFCRWAFQARLDSKQERIDNLQERIDHFQERLDAKDEQLDQYRGQLGLDAPAGSQYSRMTHTEIRNQAVRASQELRQQLLGPYNEVMRAGWMQLAPSVADDQRRRALAENEVRTAGLMNSYNERFKGRFIALRDELQSRVPRAVESETHTPLYEHPTNPIGLEMVATDLERLANLVA